MKIHGSVEIAAPPEKIWPFLVEPEKRLKWATVLEELEYTSDQRSGIGTPFYFKLKGARPIKVNFVYVEWVNNEKLVSQMTSSDFIKNYEQIFTLERTQSGTRFTGAEQIQWPYGVIGKAMGLLFQRLIKLRVGKMLATLKSLAEA